MSWRHEAICLSDSILIKNLIMGKSFTEQLEREFILFLHLMRHSTTISKFKLEIFEQEAIRKIKEFNIKVYVRESL